MYLETKIMMCQHRDLVSFYDSFDEWVAAYEDDANFPDHKGKQIIAFINDDRSIDRHRGQHVHPKHARVDTADHYLGYYPEEW